MSAPDSQPKSRFRLIFPAYRRSKKDRSLSVSAVLIADSSEPFALNELVIQIGDTAVTPQISTKNAAKRARRHRCRFSFQIDLDDAKNLTIHNKVRICINTPEGIRELGSLMYNALLPKYIAAHGPYLNDASHGTVAFFRQAVNKSLVLTVRHMNVTDKKRVQLKLTIAFVLANFMPFKRPVILYEKNARKYEESAKAVFEALIDLGYKRVFFVIDKRALDESLVNERFRKMFLYKHTFRHYLYYFRARTFVGSEAIAHSLELRCQNIFAQRHMKSRKNTFVFLQHGVMLMVSLDSPERKSFIRKAMKGKVKVVVSSEREASHFIDLAGYAHDELIVSGLPKFDFSYMDKDADKILIMPTWRIWEFNTMRTDPNQTKYTAMIREIESAIPISLRDKIITMYHPLFQEAIFGITKPGETENLDVLLRSVRLLITDYSSIAFDAFYRGANVIFYWQDLVDCMKHYGEPTHLMLDKESAFGDVCMNETELKNCLMQNYQGLQSAGNILKYRRLVTYHDGNNTNRVINALESAGILVK